MVLNLIDVLKVWFLLFVSRSYDFFESTHLTHYRTDARIISSVSRRLAAHVPPPATRATPEPRATRFRTASHPAHLRPRAPCIRFTLNPPDPSLHSRSARHVYNADARSATPCTPHRRTNTHTHKHTPRDATHAQPVVRHHTRAASATLCPPARACAAASPSITLSRPPARPAALGPRLVPPSIFTRGRPSLAAAIRAKLLSLT